MQAQPWRAWRQGRSPTPSLDGRENVWPPRLCCAVSTARVAPHHNRPCARHVPGHDLTQYTRHTPCACGKMATGRPWEGRTRQRVLPWAPTSERPTSLTVVSATKQGHGEPPALWVRACHSVPCACMHTCLHACAWLVVARGADELAAVVIAGTSQFPAPIQSVSVMMSSDWCQHRCCSPPRSLTTVRHSSRTMMHVEPRSVAGTGPDHRCQQIGMRRRPAQYP